MKAQRNIHNFWDNRARNRQATRTLTPQPKLFVLPKIAPKIAPKPTVVTNAIVAKPARMDKFTSIEKEMLADLNSKSILALGFNHGRYGYAMKLVKRGYFKVAEHRKHDTTFAVTPAGERARAGMSLLKTIQGKTGIASGATFGHTVQVATA